MTASTQWQEKLADELHKPIRRNFPKRRVIVHNVDDIWCSDLVDMQKLSKWNKGYKCLLMVLDLFSKYGWIVPLKTKTGLEVSKAFESIFQQNKPKKLWVDKGKEYYNKNVKDLLAKNNIEIFSTENEEKSSVCERWNSTIKEKMYKRFTMQNNTVYIEILPKILASYNNSKDRSMKMKKSRLSVRDGTELLKKKCTRDLLCKITLSTSTFYQKYSLLIIIAKIDQ